MSDLILSQYGQTRWTSFGVSDAESAAVQSAAEMIGRTFEYQNGRSHFTVTAVADCRPCTNMVNPARNGAAVSGHYVGTQTEGYQAGVVFTGAGAWVADLGAEVTS